MCLSPAGRWYIHPSVLSQTYTQAQLQYLTDILTYEQADEPRCESDSASSWLQPHVRSPLTHVSGSQRFLKAFPDTEIIIPQSSSTRWCLVSPFLQDRISTDTDFCQMDKMIRQPEAWDCCTGLFIHPSRLQHGKRKGGKKSLTQFNAHISQTCC